MPIEVIDPVHSLERESWWIRHFPWVYNIQRKWKPWLFCPLQQEYNHRMMGDKFAQQTVDHWLTLQHIPVSVPSLLQFLIQGKQFVTKMAWKDLLARVMYLTKVKYGINLPVSVCVPYPAGCPHLTVIQQAYTKLVKSLPMAQDWKKWLLFVTRWVPKRGPAVRFLLQDLLYKSDLTLPVSCQ
jgi:hypothetical protein